MSQCRAPPPPPRVLSRALCADRRWAWCPRDPPSSPRSPDYKAHHGAWRTQSDAYLLSACELVFVAPPMGWLGEAPSNLAKADFLYFSNIQNIKEKKGAYYCRKLIWQCLCTVEHEQTTIGSALIATRGQCPNEPGILIKCIGLHMPTTITSSYLEEV